MDDSLRRLLEHHRQLRELIEEPARRLGEQRRTFEEASKLMGAAGWSDAVKALGAVRAAHFEMPRSLSALGALSVSATLLKELPSAASFAEIADAFRQQPAVRAWQELSGANAIQFGSLVKQLGEISAYTFGAQKRLMGLDFEAIGKSLRVNEALGSQLRSITDVLARRHAETLAALSLPATRLASLPPFVSTLPSLDLYFHAEALGAMSPVEEVESSETALWDAGIEEARGFIEFALLDLQPVLLEQYLGARSAAEARRTDWWRHVAASLRQLLTRVIDLCAPHDEVRLWILNEATEFKPKIRKNGTPEFGIRLIWLCKSIPVPAYPKGVRVQIQAANKILNVLAEHVHSDELLDDARFNRLCARAEIVLYHILRIWKARQES